MAKETRKYWQMNTRRLREYRFSTEVVPFGMAPVHHFEIVIRAGSDEAACIMAGNIGQKLNLMLTLVE